MRISVRVDGGASERDLAEALQRQAPLRGRVHLVTPGGRQGPGVGSSVASILVEVGPTGLTAFAGALIAWIRHRTADTRVTVRRPDGTAFEISAQRVRGLGAEQINALVAQLSDAVDDGDGNRPRGVATRE